MSRVTSVDPPSLPCAGPPYPYPWVGTRLLPSPLHCSWWSCLFVNWEPPPPCVLAPLVSPLTLRDIRHLVSVSAQIPQGRGKWLNPQMALFLFFFPSLFIQLFNNYIYSSANFIYYQFILFTHFFIHPSHPCRQFCGPCPTPLAAIPEHSPYLGRSTRAT